MTSRRYRRLQGIGKQMTELSFATPLVMQNRLTRMAFAGAVPDAKDSAEFRRMGDEKVAAFYESWNAMWMHALRSQMQLATTLFQAWWFPWAQGSGVRNLSRSYLDNMTLGLLAKGTAPVHRRATANAKRLSRK